MSPVPAEVVVIPSGLTVALKGPGAFVEMLFPLAVQVILKAPLNWKIMDPSGAVSALPNTLSTSIVATIGNPQLSVVKPGRKSTNCHPSPRPPGGERWGSRRRASDHAQQRAERHGYCKSPRGDPPPPRHRTVARCRAYRPAAGQAAVSMADTAPFTACWGQRQ